jgi:Tfp pilus assembly PilM family ATPase
MGKKNKNSMAEKMKERAIVAPDSRSAKVVKRVNHADVEELNRSIKPILDQNEQERIASREAAEDMIIGYKG